MLQYDIAQKANLMLCKERRMCGMYEWYYAVANTNEFGLTKGKKYVIESISIGSVYVYEINGDYLTYCRKDSFDNWKLIER
jgi:hypothetical protein